MTLLRKVLPGAIGSLPLKSRIKALYFLSLFIKPLFQLKPSQHPNWDYIYRFEKGADLSLMWSLSALINTTIDFRPQINDELFRRAASKSKGVLLIGYHGYMMAIIKPYLKELGYRIHTLGMREKEIVWGNDFYNDIRLSSTSLVKIKNLLDKGENVFMLIDKEAPNPPKTVEFESTFGKMFISTSMFKLLKEIDCEVLFIKYKWKQGILNFTLAPPSNKNCLQTITADYINFLQTV